MESSHHGDDADRHVSREEEHTQSPPPEKSFHDTVSPSTPGIDIMAGI
jgi:hypothetical protein